ncbi:MAG: hypothetical protein ACT4PJ_12560 [Gemmatimonadaceae bacterium]
MARAIFSVVAGLIVAVTVIYAMNLVSHTIHPPPPGFDPRNPDAMRVLIAQLPFTAFLVIVVGWMLGAGLGAFMAVRVVHRAVRWPGYLVGTLILVASLYNMFTIPHPVWFFVAAAVGVPISTWTGTQMAYGRGPMKAPLEPAPPA